MKNNYGLEESIRNAIALLYTKIFFKKARLIRRPFYLRGKKKFRYGKGLTTGYGCRFEIINNSIKDIPNLVLGSNCKIGDYVHIASGESVKIGDNCLLASKVYISDITHGDYSSDFSASNPSIEPNERPLITKPVLIGNNVWIGENVCILPGVKIGDGVVIGANAVVTKDIPYNSISAGVPAEILKRYSDDKNIWEKI